MFNRTLQEDCQAGGTHDPRGRHEGERLPGLACRVGRVVAEPASEPIVPQPLTAAMRGSVATRTPAPTPAAATTPRMIRTQSAAHVDTAAIVANGTSAPHRRGRGGTASGRFYGVRAGEAADNGDAHDIVEATWKGTRRSPRRRHRQPQASAPRPLMGAKESAPAESLQGVCAEEEGAGNGDPREVSVPQRPANRGEVRDDEDERSCRSHPEPDGDSHTRAANATQQERRA